jgi:hypothetical protein
MQWIGIGFRVSLWAIRLGWMVGCHAVLVGAGLHERREGEGVSGLLCSAWVYITLTSAAVAVRIPLLYFHQSSIVCLLDQSID